MRHADDVFSKVDSALNTSLDGYLNSNIGCKQNYNINDNLRSHEADFTDEAGDDNVDPDAKAALALTLELVNMDEINSFIEEKKAEKEQKQLRYKALNPEFDKVMSILQAPKFDKVMKRRKVSIFIDEASEVVNEALLQLLNKARGADFQLRLQLRHSLI